MLFRHRKKARDALVLDSLPTTAKLAKESNTLADKCAAQVEWMQEKGIGGESERRSARKSAREKIDS